MSSLVRLIVDESFSVMTTFPTFGLIIQSRLLLSCGGRALKCSASKEGSCLLVSVWSCWEVVAATTTSRSDTKPSHQDRQHEQEEEIDGHAREKHGGAGSISFRSKPTCHLVVRVFFLLTFRTTLE